MELHTSLIDLLKAYVQHKGLDLKDLATEMKIPPGYFLRWSNSKTINKENLQRISDATSLPYYVCARVSFGAPVLIDFASMRFETSVFDRDLVNVDVLREHMPETLAKYSGEELQDAYGVIKPVVDGGDATNLENYIFRYIDEMYKKEILPPRWKDIVYEAAVAFPELNIIHFDRWNYYCGHILTVPTQYLDLQDVKDEYRLMQADRLVFPPWNKQSRIILHMFSTWSSHSSYVYFLIRRVALFVRVHCGRKLHPSSLLSGFPTTEHARRLFWSVGLRKVGAEAEKKHKHVTSRHTHAIFAAPLTEINELIKV